MDLLQLSKIKLLCLYPIQSYGCSNVTITGLSATVQEIYEAKTQSWQMSDILLLLYGSKYPSKFSVNFEVMCIPMCCRCWGKQSCLQQKKSSANTAVHIKCIKYLYGAKFIATHHITVFHGLTLSVHCYLGVLCVPHKKNTLSFFLGRSLCKQFSLNLNSGRLIVLTNIYIYIMPYS